jgi:hypothetical protein
MQHSVTNRRDAEALSLNELTSRVIGACIEIHRALGPGLLESAYQECLCHERALAGLPFERQQPLPVSYKGVNLDFGYRLDLVVEVPVLKTGIKRIVNNFRDLSASPRLRGEFGL